MQAGPGESLTEATGGGEGLVSWHTGAIHSYTAAVDYTELHCCCAQGGCKEAKGRLMQSAEQFWAGRETDQVTG